MRILSGGENSHFKFLVIYVRLEWIPVCRCFYHCKNNTPRIKSGLIAGLIAYKSMGFRITVVRLVSCQRQETEQHSR